jgi:hypothetical protein
MNVNFTFTPFDAQLNFVKSLLINTVLIHAFLLFKNRINVNGEKFSGSE